MDHPVKENTKTTTPNNVQSTRILEDDGDVDNNADYDDDDNFSLFFSSSLCFIFMCAIFFVSQLPDSVQKMLPRVPVPLQEAVSRLTTKEPATRPTAQLLQLIKYFR